MYVYTHGIITKQKNKNLFDLSILQKYRKKNIEMCEIDSVSGV